MRLQLFAKRTVAALVVRSKIQIQLQGAHIISYASKLKKSLFQCIKTLNQNRSEYCHSPGKDYTRNRKADFTSVTKAVLCFGGKSLNKELYEIFGLSPDTLTPSAFIQQRSKIKPEAFEELFRSFNRANQIIQLFHGYRLLAIDGSLLHTPTNKMDTSTAVSARNREPNDSRRLFCRSSAEISRS